jgi:hypothetical protein
MLSFTILTVFIVDAWLVSYLDHYYKIFTLDSVNLHAVLLEILL